MDASMIAVMSTCFGPSIAPAPACPPSFRDDGGSSGDWSWGYCGFDPGAPEPTPARTYADDAAGRRERLDDLGAEIAAAKARLGGGR